VSEEFFPATLGARQRWLAGLVGIGLGFGAPLILSVLLVATSGDPVFVILPLPFLGALWCIQGLAPRGYSLGEDGLGLERRWLRRVLPYAAIAGVHRGARPAGGLGGVGLNSLFGAHGLRWNPWTGRHYLFVTRTTGLVWLETAGGLIALSPDRPDEFAAALSRRIGAGRGGAAT